MNAEEAIARICADVVTRKTFNIRALSEMLGEEPKRARHLCLASLRTLMPKMKLKKVQVRLGEPLNAMDAAIAICGEGRIAEYPGWIDAGCGGIVCHIRNEAGAGRGMWNSFGFVEDCSFPLCNSNGDCSPIGILRQLRAMNLAFGGLYVGVHLVVENNDAGYFDPSSLAGVLSILAARNNGALRLFKIGRRGSIVERAMVVGGRDDRAAVLPISDESLVKARCYRLDIVNGKVI